MGPVEALSNPSKREEGKTWRLNFQHNLTVSVNNGFLLHPSIPSNAKNIADVGTGNGIWLEDLHKRSRSREPVEDRRFDGFDVSPTRFPKNSSCTYRVHDMSMPFPEQYHGLYDLVHVRYMALTLKKDQYVSAAENLMDLLKPGGYIQWEEVDYGDISSNPPSAAHEELISLVTRFLTSRNVSIKCSYDLQSSLKAVGFESVTREERNSYWDSKMIPEVQRWCWMTLNRFAPRALQWANIARDKDAAGIIAGELLERLDIDYRAGAVPNFAHRVILGRKSLCDI